MTDKKEEKVSEEKFIGRILDSRYSIERLIEVGGMGSVFEGSHIRLGRKIAVKILHEELIGDKVQTERFLREARAAAEIRHRNVVDVIDIGKTEEGLPYFVMELLEGESLKARMKRLKIIPTLEILWIIQDVLSALSVAHDAGIIHRDMKPGNIFICKEKDGKEIAKILDFGVAKFKYRDEGDAVHSKELTTTGTIVGTPYYMSPEQAMGKRGMIDGRSDIYSCGLILYRGLTGRNPFRGENYNEIIYNILTIEVPPPSSINKGLNPVVDEVVMKAIQREKEKRYKNCQEFIESIEKLKDQIREEENQKKEGDSTQLQNMQGDWDDSSSSSVIKVNGFEGRLDKEGRQREEGEISRGKLIGREENEEKFRKKHSILPVYLLIVGVLIVVIAGVYKFQWLSFSKTKSSNADLRVIFHSTDSSSDFEVLYDDTSEIFEDIENGIYEKEEIEDLNEVFYDFGHETVTTSEEKGKKIKETRRKKSNKKIYMKLPKN